MSGLVSSVLSYLLPATKSPIQSMVEALPLQIEQANPGNLLQNALEGSQNAWDTTQPSTQQEPQPLQKRKVSWLQKGLGLAFVIPKGLETIRRYGPLLAPHLTWQNAITLAALAYAIHSKRNKSAKATPNTGGVTNHITLHLTIPQVQAPGAKQEGLTPTVTVTQGTPIKV